jgi:hypothetical protein
MHFQENLFVLDQERREFEEHRGDFDSEQNGEIILPIQFSLLNRREQKQ